MIDALLRRTTASTSLLHCTVIAAALKVAQLLGESFRTDELLTFDSWQLYAAYKGDELLRTLLTLPIFAITLRAAGRLSWTGWRRTGAVLALALLCAFFSAALMASSLPYSPVVIRVGGSATIGTWFWYTLWANLVVVILAMVTMNHLRDRHLAVDRLQAAQDRSRVVRQQLARTQLMAIQARVDPQLLFDMLAAVKNFYQQDVDRAERLLDGLSSFLRAALPRLRQSRSTIGEEFELVASFGRLLEISADAPIRFTTELPRQLSVESFPAGLLLPLAMRVIQRRTGGQTLHLKASVDGRHLRVAIVASSPIDPTEAERLVGQLESLYGGQAQCTFHPTAPQSYGGAVLELEVPRE